VAGAWLRTGVSEWDTSDDNMNGGHMSVD
jgi:hypothetical protein